MVTDGKSWVFVDGVRNDFLPHQNLALQSVGQPENGKVMRGSLERTTDPGTLLVMD
jgi:hypothetical protein